MKNKFIPDNFHAMSPLERIQFLRSNADERREQQTVVRSLNPDEKDSLKEEYVITNIELTAKEEEYDKVKKEWQETLKPLKQKAKEHMDKIRTGYEEITSDIFLFRDHEEGRVYSILPNGEVHDSRRMLDHERQSTMQSNLRKVNDHS